MANISQRSKGNILGGAQKRINKANASGDTLSKMKANNNMVTVVDGLNRNLSTSQFGK